MSLDLNQSNVTLHEPFTAMLNNLQGNILKGHGRDFAHHLFIQVIPEKKDLAKEWIGSFAENKITTSYKQIHDAAIRGIDKHFDGGTFFNLSLSNFGYATLQLSSSILEDAVFNNGMHQRQHQLKDNFENWEPTFFQSQLDILIIVADDDPVKASNEADEIINQVEAFGKCLINQRGNVLKMDGTGVGIEHFGYADGISQPIYLKHEIDKQSNYVQWHDETNLDMLLVEEKDGHGDNCFGSYFVFRKLEQNVQGFKNAEGDNGMTAPGKILIKINGALAEVKDDIGTNNKELGGAMIVGRFENSRPVTKASKDKDDESDPDILAEDVDNDFDYSADKAGLKCPFHSHIRLGNPRNGNDNHDHEEVKSHRITRRGITYDDQDDKRVSDDNVNNVTEEMLKNQPIGGVGLLFMCYQSNIETHFEELQAQWANTGIIDNAAGKPEPVSVGVDSLISQGVDTPRSIPQQWGQPAQCDNFKFSGFVTMKGGEYFYTPSLPFLKSL